MIALGLVLDRFIFRTFLLNRPSWLAKMTHSWHQVVRETTSVQVKNYQIWKKKSIILFLRSQELENKIQAMRDEVKKERRPRGESKVNQRKFWFFKKETKNYMPPTIKSDGKCSHSFFRLIPSSQPADWNTNLDKKNFCAEKRIEHDLPTKSFVFELHRKTNWTWSSNNFALRRRTS